MQPGASCRLKRVQSHHHLRRYHLLYRCRGSGNISSHYHIYIGQVMRITSSATLDQRLLSSYQFHLSEQLSITYLSTSSVPCPCRSWGLKIGASSGKLQTGSGNSGGCAAILRKAWALSQRCSTSDVLAEGLIWSGSIPFSRSSASYRFNRSSTDPFSSTFRLFRDSLGGRKMHCTLCRTQAVHGFRLSHPTLHSEHRMQAKVGFVEDTGEFIATQRLEGSLVKLPKFCTGSCK